MINLRTGQGWQDLKRALDDRMDDVLRLLNLPEPKGNGTIVMCDPTGNDDNPSFVIWTTRPGGLSWKRYGTPNGGKTLELIAYVNGWYNQPKRGSDEAARWALDRLRLGRVSNDQLEQDRAARQQRTARERDDADKELARKQAHAFHTFTKKAVPILGTGAETYLRQARGIDLRGAPFIGKRGGMIVPHALRFLASHKYIARDKHGQKVAEHWFPCMVAACVDRDMKIRALHQTWLRPDYSDKADIPPAPDGERQKPRKVWPALDGLVIPLWRGEGHYSPREAAEQGLLQTISLSEGVEDGLTEVLAAPQHRTWAMISLSNFEAVARRLPECCDSVIVHRQNDWLKFDAVAAFDRGMTAVRATGRPVAEVAAVAGKDLNDTLRGAA